jgi:hypothetical protein
VTIAVVERFDSSIGGIWTWMFSFFWEKVKENFVGMISHFE